MINKKVRGLTLLVLLPTVIWLLGAFKAQDKTRAVRMADSEMKRFPYGWMLDSSPKPKWGYCQGLVCKAILETWKQTGDKKYFEYVKGYADTMITAEGLIKTYRLEDYNIDQINAGKILFDLYKQTKEEKYLVALKTLRSQMQTHPRTSEGGFWHKKVYPYQMWLDGLYMASPFLAQYAAEFNEPRLFDDVVKQITLVAKYTFDEKAGLFRHGWDEKRQQNWADTVTGKSPGFWSRSLGWYAMAMVDVLDFLPENHPGRQDVIAILNRLAAGIAKYQDTRTGLWYQVPDQGDRTGNYLESSGSSMFVYAMAKAVKHKYIDKKYMEIALKGFEGLVHKLIRTEKDGTLSITQCCAVAGLSANRPGTFEYYIGEKIRDNDPKSTGPFILAGLELGK
jgi:unsaturated rhamnogalacturonyl hydrolase